MTSQRQEQMLKYDEHSFISIKFTRKNRPLSMIPFYGLAVRIAGLWLQLAHLYKSTAVRLY